MELTDYIQYVVALAFVLALIGIMFWMMKKFRGSSLATGAAGRRLAVIEGAVVDSKRRLVLVRRDNVEHLILLGPTQDVVVETGISSAQIAPAKAQSSPAQHPPQKAPPKAAQSQEPPPEENSKKSGALNWKLSTKEHVEPPPPKKKAAPKPVAKSSEIRPGEQK